MGGKVRKYFILYYRDMVNLKVVLSNEVQGRTFQPEYVPLTCEEVI